MVVIGNGMVGHRFCERLAGFDVDRHFQIVTFCEERRPAYDRVNLSKYFEKRDAEHLKLACETWYAENGITLHVGDRASAIDRARRVVVSAKGREVGYDIVVLATGSAPFVPSVPGVDKKGVFVYRTIEDLERDPRLRRELGVGGGDRRRAARPGGREGGPRPRAGDARRRVRPSADASPGRRHGLEDIARQDRGDERPGPPGQEHAGISWQRQGRRLGVRRRRAT